MKIQFLFLIMAKNKTKYEDLKKQSKKNEEVLVLVDIDHKHVWIDNIVELTQGKSTTDATHATTERKETRKTQIKMATRSKIRSKQSRCKQVRDKKKWRYIVKSIH